MEGIKKQNKTKKLSSVANEHEGINSVHSTPPTPTG